MQADEHSIHVSTFLFACDGKRCTAYMPPLPGLQSTFAIQLGKGCTGWCVFQGQFLVLTKMLCRD